MSSSVTLGLPDFERLASVMDGYLPLIEPVGRAIVDRLPPLSDDASVLDVACGTGEPGLTLARRAPTIRLLGIDGVAPAIEIARAKAARDGLTNVRFAVMSAEHLACEDGTFDAVVSRFGLLMFGEALASAREMRRVLRPGGAFSLAVWDDMATNTLVRTLIEALRPFVPAELIAPFENAVGAHAGERLREAGFTSARTETFAWDYSFPDDTALWAFVSSPGLFERHHAAVPEQDRPRVRERVTREFEKYKVMDGGFRIPHVCRLWWGRR